MLMRKRFFSLEEVGIELEGLGIERWHLVLLSDLQQGVLPTLVEFPTYRSSTTTVPRSAWTSEDVDRFFRRSGRRGWRDSFDFHFCVSDFHEQEERLLQQAMRAASRRDQTQIPREIAAHMTAEGLLLASMGDPEWTNALSWLTDCWVHLSALSGNDPLPPIVEEFRLRDYLLSVKRDHSALQKPKHDRNPGGRPPSPHWLKVYETTIRELINRGSPLCAGEIQQFAEHVRKKVKLEEGESELGSHSTGKFKIAGQIPNADTIAQRLRSMLHERASIEVSRKPS